MGVGLVGELYSDFRRTHIIIVKLHLTGKSRLTRNYISSYFSPHITEVSKLYVSTSPRRSVQHDF